MAEIFIGTSGFSYPHWKGVFYPQDLPQKDWFSFYCQNFSTVEINSSFYHLPKRETFEKWRREASKNFVFSLKGWRWITHIKKLKNCGKEVKGFFESAGPIFQEKDIILWQFPPSLKADSRRLEEFLKMLSGFLPRCQTNPPPGSLRMAFEFREESWLNEEIYDLLEKYKAAIVFQDYPQWPITDKKTADFVYLRFHGRTSLYSSCYTRKELSKWVGKIRKWMDRGLDVYAYFNNDALGWAVKNAATLKILSTKF